MAKLREVTCFVFPFSFFFCFLRLFYFAFFFFLSLPGLSSLCLWERVFLLGLHLICVALTTWFGVCSCLPRQPSWIFSKPPATDPTDSPHEHPARTLVTGHFLQVTPWMGWSVLVLRVRTPPGQEVSGPPSPTPSNKTPGSPPLDGGSQGPGLSVFYSPET